MTFFNILTAYININMLVIAGYLSLLIYPILADLLKKTIGARSLLKMHYGVLSILFLLIVFYPLLPEKNSFYPSVQIWSSESTDAYAGDYTTDDNDVYQVDPIIKRTESFDINNVRLAVTGAVICLLFTGVINISRDMYKLTHIRNGSYLIRRCGSVSIYANDSIKVPFSYWLPGMANIFIPTELLGKRTDYKITLLHELQHHRNGDTKWLYFVWLLKSVCILNPCIHLWCRLISELQEFTCDEVLVDQKRFNDWQLSVLAYNIGEGNVQKTIEKTGSRDVWDVSRAFYRKNNYYAKFMAAVIIMKNPDSVAEQMESLAKQDKIKMIWPIKGWVSSKFGYRTSPITGEKEFHNGLDISARSGTPIVAAASGTVKEVKSSTKNGLYMILKHNNNFQTLYSHCQEILFKEGQSVKMGDTIATCGNTGISTGPHLHFELRYDEMPVNP